jgi:hypothetical protein
MFSKIMVLEFFIMIFIKKGRAATGDRCAAIIDEYAVTD